LPHGIHRSPRRVCLFPKGVAKIVVADRIFWVESDCLAVYSDRFVELALVAKGAPESEVRKLRDRLLVELALDERIAETEESDHFFGVASDCPPEFCGRFIELALVAKGVSEIPVGDRVLGVESGGRTIFGNGPPNIACAMLDITGVIMGLRSELLIENVKQLYRSLIDQHLRIIWITAFRFGFEYHAPITSNNQA